MDATIRDSASAMTRVAAVLSVIALALYLRPYTGIRHDAILYLGQTLLERYPAIYANDLFFAFGSQASFTLFPDLAASLLDWMGPDQIFLWGAALGRAFFVACSWVLVHAIFPRGLRFPALLALLALPSGYGAFNIFKYGEVFLTARPFAEGLVLLAFAALVRNRWAIAPLAFGAAALLHPLPAITGAGVAWMWLALGDRRWLHAGWMAAPVVLLAALDIGPFGRLMEQFDPRWLDVMKEMNDHCFLLQWPLRDWLYWITDLYLIYLVYKSNTPILSRLAGASGLALVLATAGSIIFGDILRLSLPLGLQLWRVQWITHWIAMAAIPLLASTYLHQRPPNWIRVALLVAVVVVGAPTGYGNVPWANALLIPLHAAWPYLDSRTTRSTRILVLGGAIAAVTVHFARYVLTQWSGFRAMDFRPDLFRFDVLLLSHPALIGLLVFGGLLTWKHASRYLRCALVLVLAGITLWSGARWDYRTEWVRNIEGARLNPSLFGVPIEKNAQVYWEEQLLATWLALGRSSYYNPGQQAGQMFNRDTAIEASNRSRRLAPLALQAGICSLMARLDEQSPCFINRFALEHACVPGGAARPPDYLVLPFRQPEPAIGEWVIPDSVRGGDAAQYYLYRCTDLMKGAGTPGGAGSG